MQFDIILTWNFEFVNVLRYIIFAEYIFSKHYSQKYSFLKFKVVNDWLILFIHIFTIYLKNLGIPRKKN